MHSIVILLNKRFLVSDFLHNRQNMYLLLLSWVVFLLGRLLILCNGQVQHGFLNGSSVTSIPTDMEPAAMTYLKIFNTNIQTLDLRQLLPYTSLQCLEVETSPVTKVLSADLPSLQYLHFNSLNMIVPPTLDPLSPQLMGLSFSKSFFTTIPDDYFSNFTRLKGVGLAQLGLTSLRGTWLTDLNRLRKIYISENPLGSLPPLQLWFPKLERVYAKSIGMTSIPVALIKGLKSPAVLRLEDNNITSVPRQDDFDPIAKWQLINLKGNPLHCDKSLCWIKVRERCGTMELVSLSSVQETVSTIYGMPKRGVTMKLYINIEENTC